MKAKYLRYLVRAVALNGVTRDVTQVSSEFVAIERANVSAEREDTQRAFVLDLLSPIGASAGQFKIIHETV